MAQPVTHYWQLEFNDPKKNSHKFYRIEVRERGPDDFVIVGRWGRIGTYGQEQVKSQHYDIPNAVYAAGELKDSKTKKGYKQVDFFASPPGSNGKSKLTPVPAAVETDVAESVASPQDVLRDVVAKRRAAASW